MIAKVLKLVNNLKEEYGYKKATVRFFIPIEFPHYFDKNYEFKTDDVRYNKGIKLDENFDKLLISDYNLIKRAIPRNSYNNMPFLEIILMRNESSELHRIIMQRFDSEFILETTSRKTYNRKMEV